MAFNNRQSQDPQQLVNVPLGGQGKSSAFVTNGQGKLLFRGTMSVLAMHQAIEQANSDPQNSSPGNVSLKGYQTNDPNKLYIVVAPVRKAGGGGGNWGKRGQQQPQWSQPQQQQWSPPPPQQQWGGPQTLPPQAQQNFQQMYQQPAAPAPVEKDAPPPKARSKKAPLKKKR